jgi:hypothetical protein
MATPNFKNAGEQLIWYSKRFLSFCGQLAIDSKITSLSHEEIESRLDEVPPALVVGWILEANEKYGEALANEDLGPVAKLVAAHSPSGTPEGIIKDVQKFTDHIMSHPDSKKKFFLYLKVIRQIVSNN